MKIAREILEEIFGEWLCRQELSIPDDDCDKFINQALKELREIMLSEEEMIELGNKLLQKNPIFKADLEKYNRDNSSQQYG